MRDISIRILEKSNFSYLDNFLNKCSQSTIYHSKEFWRFLEESSRAKLSCIVVLERSEIKGILPVCTLKVDNVGTVINSLSWFGSHGGCLLLNENDQAVRIELLRTYAEVVSKPDISASTLILPLAEEPFLNDYMANLQDSIAIPRRGQVSRLPSNGENVETQILTGCTQKTRNLIRKSLKQNFSLLLSDDLVHWKYLHNEHQRGSQVNGAEPKPWSHFMAIRNHFPSEQRSLLVATKNSLPVAALLLLHKNKQVEYITPVITPEYRSTQPLSFLIFNAMVKFVKAGYTEWNWGGTAATLESLHHFKSGWGAQDTTYHAITHIKPDFLSKLKRDKVSISDSFPFFYLYPYQYL